MNSNVEQFEEHREYLFGLAYRMLGSVADAEDAVQDTFLRWRDADHGQILSAQAWLTRVCSRLAIDRLRTLRTQRETYIGPWLPEPVVSDAREPLDQLEIDETVSIALLAVLETLSPGERAAFILHDVFDLPFDEIAAVLDRSPAACRQLASRARRTVRRLPPEPAPALRGQARLEVIDQFLDAIRSGELERVQALLAADVSFHSDGGGRVQAAREVLAGRDRVAKFLFNLPSLRQLVAHESFVIRWFNGAPGVVVFVDGEPATALSFAMNDGVISGIYAIRNPEKLGGFAAVG